MGGTWRRSCGLAWRSCTHACLLGAAVLARDSVLQAARRGGVHGPVQGVGRRVLPAAHRQGGHPRRRPAAAPPLGVTSCSSRHDSCKRIRPTGEVKRVWRARLRSARESREDPSSHRRPRGDANAPLRGGGGSKARARARTHHQRTLLWAGVAAQHAVVAQAGVGSMQQHAHAAGSRARRLPFERTGVKAGRAVPPLGGGRTRHDSSSSQRRLTDARHLARGRKRRFAWERKAGQGRGGEDPERKHSTQTTRGRTAALVVQRGGGERAATPRPNA